MSYNNQSKKIERKEGSFGSKVPCVRRGGENADTDRRRYSVVRNPRMLRRVAMTTATGYLR